MRRAELLGSSWNCECGKRHEVPVRAVLIERGALLKTPGVLKQLGLSGALFLVTDETTFDVAGRKLKDILSQAGFQVRSHVLPEHPHADDVTAESVARAVGSTESAVISCGSGTITDLGKYAAFRNKKPFVAVATAPSMNGYASGIVALTCGGLKTTQAVVPAVAIIADIDILAAAPLPMIRAGLGDLLSKPVANADWKLASLLEGEAFCEKPFELIRDLEGIYCDYSTRLVSRDPATIGALTEAIVYSGISMVMAGSSSPASGGEHLISHFLDMAAPIEGRTPDFHGAQVGVGTIATARLYERIMRLTARDFNSRMLETSGARAQKSFQECTTFFRGRIPTLATEFTAKWGDERVNQRRATFIQEHWEDIKRGVTPLLQPAARFTTILTAAGAKTRYGELGVSREAFRAALNWAWCIRKRWTILDLAFSLGELEPWREEMAP